MQLLPAVTISELLTSRVLTAFLLHIQFIPLMLVWLGCGYVYKIYCWCVLGMIMFGYYPKYFLESLSPCLLSIKTVS